MTNTDDGTVLVTKPGSAIEQRKVRIRYGGQSLVSLMLLAVAVALTFLGRYEWALLGMSLEVALLAHRVVRHQKDLQWVTGYDKNDSA